jgi:hypothetical protein
MISLEYCLLLAENDFQVEIKLINTDGIARTNYLILEPGNYRNNHPSTKPPLLLFCQNFVSNIPPIHNIRTSSVIFHQSTK